MAEEAVILRDEKGRWLPGSRPANLITTENAHLLHEARRLKRQLCEEGAERGVIAAAAAVVDRPIASAHEAHEVLAEAVTLGGLTAAEKGQMRDAVAGIGYGLRLAGQAPAEDKAPAVAIQVNIQHIGADVAQLADDSSVPEWEDEGA